MLCRLRQVRQPTWLPIAALRCVLIEHERIAAGTSLLAIKLEALAVRHSAASMGQSFPGVVHHSRTLPQHDARRRPARNSRPVGRFRHLEVVHTGDVLDDAPANVIPDVDAEGEVRFRLHGAVRGNPRATAFPHALLRAKEKAPVPYATGSRNRPGMSDVPD